MTTMKSSNHLSQRTILGYCKTCGNIQMTLRINTIVKWHNTQCQYSINCNQCQRTKHTADYNDISRLIPWFDSEYINPPHDPGGNHYMPPTNIDAFINAFTNPYYHENSGWIIEYTHLDKVLHRWWHVYSKQNNPYR